MAKKIQISESEKNEILGMYLTEVKIDDTSKSEIYNYLKNKNKEFISKLVAKYNSEVPSSSKFLIGSLSNLENALVQYFNSQIPSFLLLIEQEGFPDASLVKNFINGVVQIMEKEVDEKLSGVGGWTKKQALKSLIKDKKALIDEFSSNEKMFKEYVKNILGLVHEWVEIRENFCKKTISSQMCKKYFGVAPDFNQQKYGNNYTSFFIKLWVYTNREIDLTVKSLATKIANKLFD
jgi:hypothetical protein